MSFFLSQHFTLIFKLFQHFLSSLEWIYMVWDSRESVQKTEEWKWEREFVVKVIKSELTQWNDTRGRVYILVQRVAAQVTRLTNITYSITVCLRD